MYRRLVLLLAFTLFMTACGGGGDDATPASTDSTPATTSETTASSTTTQAPASTSSAGVDTQLARFIGAFGEVGDCLLVAYNEAGDEFDYATLPERVDCAGPHDHEVIFTGEVPGDPGAEYPGDDAMFSIVFEELCRAPFEARYGTSVDMAATLSMWGTWPQQEEWDAGLRTAKCSAASWFSEVDGTQLLGDAASAGLVLPGHLLATVAEFDMKDVYIYIFGDEGETLDVVNLTVDDLEVNEATTPVSWSPDLSTIVYAADLPDGNAEIFVVDVATGEKTNISNHPADDFGPAFSPDGSRIAFGSQRTGGEANLFLMDPDGGNVEQLTFHDDRDSSADWSPDGSRIVFRRRIDGNSDIWTVNADGSDAAFLVGGPGGEFDPDWSPDGSTIAFISDEGGSFDIWTFPADGVATAGAPSLEAALAARITDHPANEEYPEWSPDGQFLLFNSDRHGVQDVWMMRADGSDQTALLFTYPVGWPQAVVP